MATATGTLTTIGDTIELSQSSGETRATFTLSGTYATVTGIFELR